MAIYPSSPDDRAVRPSVLTTVVTDIFARCDMSAADARLLADSLVYSDVRGISSHGVLRVPDYVKKLLHAGVDPRGRPAVVSDRGAAIVVDGGNSMGQIGGTFAMEKAITRAGEIGVAIAAVRGSNHCGALDWYTLMAVRQGMIGMAATNALPTMAPWGGTDKIIGINPVSIAIPAGRNPPFVLDFAFGATAHGKIRVYHQKGSPIPEGWAFDASGMPTTDAAAALEGLIQPIGQHKGLGLGMAMGLLSSVLSGAAYGTEMGNMVDGPKAGADGHFFMAINVAFFEDPVRFGGRVDAVIDEVHRSGRRAGVDRLYVPGEIEADFEKISGETTYLAGPTFDDLIAVAAVVGADPSPLLSEPSAR